MDLGRIGSPAVQEKDPAAELPDEFRAMPLRRQLFGNGLELFEGGLQVVGDFLSENVRGG